MKPSIDRFRFAVKLPIDPQVVNDHEKFASTHGFPDLSLKFGYDQRTRRRTVLITLLPNNALQVFAEQVGSRWTARSVMGTAGSIINGHNGRVISGDYDWTAVLGRTRHLCSKLIPEFFHDEIIPGESKTSLSYWTYLEVFFHAEDPDDSLFNAFRCMRHRLIRKLARYYDKETVALLGKTLKFVVYDKTSEMVSTLEKFNAPIPPRVLRFELRLSSAALPTHFAQKRNLREINEKPRVVAFTLDDMKEVFLRFVRELDGVYMDRAPKRAPAVARFIGEVARRSNMTTLDLTTLYATEKELSPASLSQLRSDAAKHYAALGDTRAQDVFSEDAFNNQPSIVVPRLEEAMGDMVGRFGFQNMAIARAYTILPAYGLQPDGRFVPQPIQFPLVTT
jgi:hypothetical protein